MKISGSMNRRILYYYVPAKFRSLFSFSCSQRAHNLLSTMRQATKLHCCSANRVVLVDGLTRCEVCLSAAAAATEGSLGTPFPSRSREKEIDKKERGVKQQVAFLVSVFFFPSQAGKQFGWWRRQLNLLSCASDSQHPVWSFSRGWFLLKNDARAEKKASGEFFLDAHPSFVKAYAWVNLCVCPGELRGCYAIQLWACVLGSGKGPMAQGTKEEGGGGRGEGGGGGNEGFSVWVLIDPSWVDRQGHLSTLTPASAFALRGGQGHQPRCHGSCTSV